MSRMMTRNERLLALALRLSPEDQAALAEKIRDSVEEDAQSGDLSDEEKAELDRRLAEMEENPDDEKPWEEVRRERFRAR